MIADLLKYDTTYGIIVSPLIESKRLERLFKAVERNRKNCSFEDLERLLLAVGFKERTTGGSHVVFARDGIRVTVPRRKPVKEIYVDQVVAIVETIIERR